MKKKQKHRTPQQIIEDKQLEKLTKKITDILSSEEEIDLTSKTVRLKHDDIKARISRGEMSETFKQWFNENKNSQFVAKRVDNMYGLYEFEGVDGWLFSIVDLEVIG